MKKLILVLMLTGLMAGCGQSPKQRLQPQDLSTASREELENFYQNLSDNEVKKIVAYQNKPKCVSEFTQGQIAGNVDAICDCFVDEMINIVGIDIARHSLIPELMLSEAEKIEITGRFMIAMPSAVQACLPD